MKFKAMPSAFPGQQIWGAIGKKGTYVVLKDEGFTASIKRLGITKYLIEYDTPVASLQEAIAVCESHESTKQ